MIVSIEQTQLSTGVWHVKVRSPSGISITCDRDYFYALRLALTNVVLLLEVDAKNGKFELKDSSAWST